MIKKLDDKTIFKIKSDITIPTLSSVIKELFENSLDAGATKIEIILKGNGFKSIIVEDDGSGIEKENRENLCHRFYTSKLVNLDEGVSNFGFRGEALNSLCRDCGSVEIWTKTAEETCGTILNYDTDGNLIKSTPSQSKKFLFL
jgi:DNA mismatch repair ATPase MutL